MCACTVLALFPACFSMSPGDGKALHCCADPAVATAAGILTAVVVSGTGVSGCARASGCVE
jgi:hypothetical protein